MRDLLADCLAAYRLTRLGIADDLPPVLAVRRKVKGWVRRQAGDEWAGGLSCPWCVSVHVGLGMVLVARRFRWWPPVRDALALSAAVGLLGAAWPDAMQDPDEIEDDVPGPAWAAAGR